MRPYGVPRHANCKYPDCGDCTYYGKQSKHMKQHSRRKRETRRIWKKKERARVRDELHEMEKAA